MQPDAHDGRRSEDRNRSASQPDRGAHQTDTAHGRCRIGRLTERPNGSVGWRDRLASSASTPIPSTRSKTSSTVSSICSKSTCRRFRPERRSRSSRSACCSAACFPDKSMSHDTRDLRHGSNASTTGIAAARRGARVAYSCQTRCALRGVHRCRDRGGAACVHVAESVRVQCARVDVRPDDRGADSGGGRRSARVGSVPASATQNADVGRSDGRRVARISAGGTLQRHRAT